MSIRVSCPNVECNEGTVYVYNAYAADPLKPEAQICKVCLGHAFIFSGDENASAS